MDLESNLTDQLMRKNIHLLPKK